jgi:uncharacterized repeat protein (TIGR03803 family)
MDIGRGTPSVWAFGWVAIPAILLVAAVACPTLCRAQLPVPGATETILYPFADGADGAFPNDLIPYTDGNFYGVTTNTMFRVTPGGALTTLYTFCTAQVQCPNGKPTPAGLTVGTDGNFYGLSQSSAGPAGQVFFRLTPLGAYTAITALSGSDGNPAGVAPAAGAKLVLGSDGNFYGVDAGSGSASGSVFQITPAGVFTTLYTFTAATGGINSDGSKPYGRLTQASDGNFYGTTWLGGTYGVGTVFRITTGGAFTSLYSFGTAGGLGSANTDGYTPFAGLTQGSDGNLYGGTTAGGAHGRGTLFRMTTGGVLSPLHQFSGATNLAFNVNVFPATISLGQNATLSWSTAGVILSEGGGPKESLLLGRDGNFYGFGNEISSGSDTVFQLTPAGAFTTILQPPSGETEPDSLFQTADGRFYGTNYYGASAGDYGSVFGLSVANGPPVTPCAPSVSPVTGGGVWSAAQPSNGMAVVTPTAVGTYFYSLTCTYTGNPDSPVVGPVYAILTVTAPTLPTYAGGQLTLPTVLIGNANYSNMVVTLGHIVSGPSGSAPIGAAATYDPATDQLTIPAVVAGSTTYYNVVITVGSLVSIGSVTGADLYNGAYLSIPVVQVLGGSTYDNVAITVAGIDGLARGMPSAAQDEYDPATNRLLIPAVVYADSVYTNVTITVGSLLP